MAEIELGVMTGQCLGSRIDSQEIVTQEVAAWEKTRNKEKAKIRIYSSIKS